MKTPKYKITIENLEQPDRTIVFAAQEADWEWNRDGSWIYENDEGSPISYHPGAMSLKVLAWADKKPSYEDKSYISVSSSVAKVVKKVPQTFSSLLRLAASLRKEK